MMFLFTAQDLLIQKDDEHEDNQILNELNINLTSAVLLTVPIIKSMKSNKEGMILYIGSSSSYAGFKNTSIYCSSKHGLLGFSRSLADEYRELGIRILYVFPLQVLIQK